MAAACSTEVAGDLEGIESAGFCDSTRGFISRRVDNPPGRPVARIERGSAPTARLRTNRGYLDVSESDVDAFDNHWASGCLGKFCVLYWQNSDGYFMYANVPRSIVQVRSNDVWKSANEVCVRRLGNLALEGGTALRYLTPTHNLDDICHTDSTGDCLRYSAYAFISGPCESGGGTCTFTTGADAPPMYRITIAGKEYIGRGYTTGIYSAGKEFHRTRASVYVPVKRISDGAPGKAEWIYGYVNVSSGRVYMWVIRRAIVNGTTYWGYATRPHQPAGGWRNDSAIDDSGGTGCGDGECADDETDSSCPADCGCAAVSCDLVSPFGCYCDAACESTGDCCADADICE